MGFSYSQLKFLGVSRLSVKIIGSLASFSISIGIILEVLSITGTKNVHSSVPICKYYHDLCPQGHVLIMYKKNPTDVDNK